VFSEINRMSRAHDHMKTGLRSFGRYVPRQLVAQLMRTGQEARVGGEVREVTVLFTDIVGFTTIVEREEPDIVLAALSDYLTEMNMLIQTEDGTVAQYLGDAIMAFWGAPEPRPDHALSACRAALHIRDKVQQLIEAAPQKGMPALPTRIGVNTGACMVGNIGAAERFSYTILGDPVNTASRIEGLNKEYGTTVLIGERTAELVADHLLVRPVDWVRVKGREGAMLVYELLGERGSDQALEERVDAFGAALRRYRERQFLEASAAFSATPWAEPLASRATAFAADPPPDDWDGTFTMRTK
jgi:adenylate cyclase